MRTATSFTLLAIGAILAFAVTGDLSFLNVQITGLILMATGVAGLFLPGPTQGWLRRRIILRRGSRGPVVGQVEETRYPPYILNPGAPVPAGVDSGVVWEEPEGSVPSLLSDLEGGDVTVEHESPVVDHLPPADPQVVEEYIEE
jgi:hypothetical protein